MPDAHASQAALWPPGGDDVMAPGSRFSPRRAIGNAAIVLVLAGCGSRDRTTDKAGARLHAEVSAIPGLSVAARVTVTAPGAQTIVVRHRPEGGGTFVETPPLVVPPAGSLSTTVIALEPGGVSQVEVEARYAEGRTETSSGLTVTTPPLPPDVPRQLDVPKGRGEGTGYVTLSMNQKETNGGLAAIVDRAGRVLWYRRCARGVLAFDKLPNGRLLVHQFGLQAFEEMELDGTVVRRWTDPKSGAGADGHDLRLLPNGNALIVGSETHDVDSRPFFPKGVPKALRWDNTINEITPDGTVLWRWSSWSRVSEDEITEDPTEPIVPHDYEITHANSLDPAPDGGSVLASFRDMSSIVKVDRRTGDIVWRLGGKRSTFRFENDSKGRFSRQHDARFVGPRRILLFDNGNLHAPPESRAVEYELDETRATARLVWQYRHDPPLFAGIAGSVQRLPSGNTLISFGPRGTVTEVDARSEVVWELVTPKAGVYRARVIDSPYP